MPVALIVDDELRALTAMMELVEEEGFSSTGAGSLAEARERLGRIRPDVVFVDHTLPDGNGFELLQGTEPAKRPEVILMTDFASADSAVAALRTGVLDYLTKPVDIRRLRTVLANVSRTLALKKEIGSLRDELRELGRFGQLNGDSPVLGVGAPTPAAAPPAPDSVQVGMSLADIERHFILATLEHFGGDKRKAAEVLGISLKTIYNRLNEYSATLSHS